MGQEQYAALMNDEAHPNSKGQQKMAAILFEKIVRKDSKALSIE